MSKSTAAGSAEPTLERRLADRLRPAGAAVLHQRWEQLLFLHWKYPAEEIQRTLPTGLRVDLFQGAAWVGLVPLFMRDVRPRFTPAIPWVSNFLELNLRTYVHDANGRPGLYFYSLACDQPLIVEAARNLLRLQYEHASMQAEVSAQGVVTFESRRMGEAESDHFNYRAHDDAPMDALPGSLEFFLIERYRLFAGTGGNLISIQVHHPPYSLRRATVGQWGAQAFGLAGLTPPDRAPDHVCAASPVDVEVFLPEPLRDPEPAGAD